MRKSRSTRPKIADAVSWLRILILLVTPFLAALDYGGVLPWTQWAIGLAAAAILVLLIPEWFGHAVGRPLTAMLVTVAMLVAVGGFLQSCRLPQSLASTISAGAKFAYVDMIAPQLRAEASHSDDVVLKRLAETGFPVSISPARTLSACGIPILFAVFALGAACSFNSRTKVLVLLFALAGAGTVLSFIGIADRMRAAENRLADAKEIGEPFATFVNRNNAAAYLNLSLAAVAGCMVWRYGWQRQQRPWDDRYDITNAGVIDLVIERLRRMVTYADTLTVLLSVSGSVILLGILVGGSRGGLLGVVAGIILAGFQAISRRHTMGYMVAVSLAAVFSVVAIDFIGSLGQVRTRTATIWQDDFTTTARWSHWQDAVTTALQYLPAGAGLGAYEYAYLPYQKGTEGKSFEHADNLYLEILVEGGLWLPLLVISAILVLVIALRQLQKTPDSPTAAGIITTSWYLLAAIGVSQAFDFAVLLPANYLAIGLILGVLVGNADKLQLQRRYRRRRVRKTRIKKTPRNNSWNSNDEPRETLSAETDSASPRSWPAKQSSMTLVSSTRKSGRESATDESAALRRVANPEERESVRAFSPMPLGVLDRIMEKGMRPFKARLAVPLLSVLLFGFLMLIVAEARGRAHVDAWWRQEKILRDGGAPRSPVAIQIDPRLEQLEDARPLDATTQITAAKWRLLVDRADAVRAATNNPQHPFAEKPAEAWWFADPRSRRAAFHSGETNAGDDPAGVLLPGQELGRLQQARNNALRAVLANPLDVTARELLIQLDFVAPSRDADNVLFDQIAMLRCNWSPTLQHVAKLAFIHPGPDAAIPLWRRALTVDPQFLDIYWKDVQAFVNESTFVRAIPDDPSLYLRFAELSQDEVVRDQVLDLAQASLSQQSPSAEASAVHQYNLGRVAEMKGNLMAAEMHYSAAVLGNPSLPEWRFRYAVVLERNAHFDQAREQISRCLLQSPVNKRYLDKKRQLRDK